MYQFLLLKSVLVKINCDVIGYRRNVLEKAWSTDNKDHHF